MKFLEKKVWQWVVLIILAFVWGSSFILMKKGLRSFDYMQVAALRVFIAFVILLPIAIKNLRKVTRRNFIHLLITGYAGVFFPAFLFTKAETQISSSLAGMLNSLAPFFALLMGIILYRNRPGKYQYAGIALGFIGAIGLITNGDILSVFQGANYYALYVVVATLGYGINANEVRFKLKGLTGVEITSLSIFFTGLPAGIYLLFSDYSYAMSTPDWHVNLFFVFILSLFGSVLSLFFYNNLIQHTSALFATSVTYIIPFFAIIWGIFDGETITLIHVTSISVALLGVWLVNKR